MHYGAPLGSKHWWFWSSHHLNIELETDVHLCTNPDPAKTSSWSDVKRCAGHQHHVGKQVAHNCVSKRNDFATDIFWKWDLKGALFYFVWQMSGRQVIANAMNAFRLSKSVALEDHKSRFWAPIKQLGILKHRISGRDLWNRGPHAWRICAPQKSASS